MLISRASFIFLFAVIIGRFSTVTGHRSVSNVGTGPMSMLAAFKG